MAKEKFVPVNGAYNITSEQKDEFTQFLRNKIKQNNKFTPSGKPSKEGVITKRYFQRLEEQIKTEPSNYLWSHRRWKHKREK